MCRIARLTAMLETPSFSQKAVVPRETHDSDFDRFAPSIQAENSCIFRLDRGHKTIKIIVMSFAGTTAFCEKEGASRIVVSRAMRHNSEL